LNSDQNHAPLGGSGADSIQPSTTWDASSGLMKLRPVTYRYKQAYADGRRPIDYGLIAEEAEAVYPDLVAHSKDGEVETVQYQKINATLLNEVQKQHLESELLKARLAALEAKDR
jgi:Chaperone of endosialidase